MTNLGKHKVRVVSKFAIMFAFSVSLLQSTCRSCYCAKALCCTSLLPVFHLASIPRFNVARKQSLKN
jgi:hypothetical protein